MLFLESGGCRRGCVAFNPSAQWTVIKVVGLPNPYARIKAGHLRDDLEVLQRWIAERAPARWKRAIDKCVAALRKGKHVRVQCVGGQHRSCAVVEAVARTYLGPLTVVHNDRNARAPPTSAPRAPLARDKPHRAGEE